MYYYDYRLIVTGESLKTGIGMPKNLCAVIPLGNNVAAIPVVAITATFIFS